MGFRFLIGLAPGHRSVRNQEIIYSIGFAHNCAGAMSLITFGISFD